jgi:TP901 family phage tail tape measure protein
MAEGTTHVISIGASIGVRVDEASEVRAKQKLQNDFKDIKVPVGAKVDANAIRDVAKQINDHIKKTGKTKFNYNFQSDDLVEAQNRVDDLKQKYKELKNLRDMASNPSFKRATVRNIEENGSYMTGLIKSKEHARDINNDFYDAAMKIWNEDMGPRAKKSIGESNFKKNVMNAWEAKKVTIDNAVGSINRITSKKDWINNPDYVNKVVDNLSKAKIAENYIKQFTQKNATGSKYYKELFSKFDIDTDSLLGGLNDGVEEAISSLLKSRIDEVKKDLRSAVGKTKRLNKKYSKEWDDYLAGVGIVVEDKEISTQKYNGAKRSTENLIRKKENGEDLSKEDLEKIQKNKEIMESYTPKEGSNVQPITEEMKNFFEAANKQMSLMQREIAKDFEMPKDMDQMSSESLTTAFQDARNYINAFNEKIKNNQEIYAEEAKGIEEAVKTIDKYKEIKAKDGASIKDDWSKTSRDWLEKNRENIYKLNDKSVSGTVDKVSSSGNDSITKDEQVTESEHPKESSVKVTADTSQLESALAKVDEKIASYENKDIVVNLKANDSELNTVLQGINELRSKDNIDIAINFKANTENIDTVLQGINELRSKDNIDVAVNFKGNAEDLEKAISSTQKLKDDSNGKDTNIDINVNDEELTQAESKLTSLREKASEPIKVSINTDAVLDDLVAVEKIINDLKKNLDLKVKFNTGQSFTDKKASDIETMTNKIANLADKSTAYSAKIAGAFAGIGSSIREVTRLVDNLNKKFNLTGEIATGLKNMNKVLAGGNVGGANDGTALGNTNPKSDRVKNAADRALSKTIVSQDLEQYTTEFATKVEATVNRIRDLKEKHSGDVFFDNKEIEEDIRELNRLNAELTEHGRLRNQFKLQNNQGTVIGEGLSLNDFNEAKAEELFRASGVNSNILETSMGRNGMAAYIKARSRDDGKLEKYAINFNQDTGIARSQLKSRSEYKSLFGQIVGDMGQEVTKLSKYLISMGGIDVVWQGFQQGIESIKEMDAAMTELKKVTSDTSDVYATVEKDMYATGKDIGRDAVELTKSTADWARLGYNTQDSEKMSKWTGILMNVSEFEQVDDATNALISIMQGFNKGADDVENVVDVLNNIGNLEPISSDEIASSLQRSASALQAAGANYEQSVALTTVGNSVVQNPESVGAGLKTVSLRIRGTDMNVLQEAGEDVDGYIQNTSQLRDLIKNQTKVASNDYKGFDLLKDDGSYKNPYEFLLGLGKIWSEIGSTDGGDLKQASILEKIAGKNRANIVASILQKPEMLEKVYNETQNSEGSALRENETQLDSIQGKVDQLTASFQEMWNTSISSDFIKGLVDAGTQITNLVTKAGLLRTAFMGALGVAGAKGKLGRANYQLSSCTMPRAI